MNKFLTTRELAALLRVKERKIYELAAAGALPVRKVTGKLLFPREEISAWIAGGEAPEKTGAAAAAAAGPPVMVGGHDPLLEWALRESGSGIAAFFDGALDGLRRGAGAGYVAAGLHIPEDGMKEWNVGAVRERFGDRPVVLVEWGKRTRGLVSRPGLGARVATLSAARRLRFQSRQAEAGSELVLDELLKREGLTRSDLHCLESVERSETDLAMAIASGRADVGLGLEASARQFQLEFAPLVVERFDLLVWRKAWFDPPMQALLRFCAGEAFRRRAADLGGYEVKGFGTVRFNGP